MKLHLCPMTLREANAFVLEHHRHSVPARGCISVVGLSDGDRVVGVAIMGRPVARLLHDGWTAEVLRVCVIDGQRNACSMLYGACWRAARALGYRRLITYIREDEDGASARAAGFHVVGEVTARSWHTPSRPRVDRDERVGRLRLEIGNVA